MTLCKLLNFSEPLSLTWKTRTIKPTSNDCGVSRHKSDNQIKPQRGPHCRARGRREAGSPSMTGDSVKTPNGSVLAFARSIDFAVLLPSPASQAQQTFSCWPSFLCLLPDWLELQLLGTQARGEPWQGRSRTAEPEPRKHCT